MGGWVGIDDHGATFKEFGIEGRPQTILIDAKGIVRGYSSPVEINETVIDQMIAGAAAPMTAHSDTPVGIPMELDRGAPPPFLQILIRPAASVSVSGFSRGAELQTEDGRFEYFGATLKMLLANAENLREDRIIAPDWLDGSRYDFSVAVPQGRQGIRKDLSRRALTVTFQIKSHREMRPVSVYSLHLQPGSTIRMKISRSRLSPGFTPAPGHFTGLATPLSRLTNVLERDLGGSEVLDETGLTALYDFDLEWQKGNPESLASAVRTQLGLTLSRETRDREFLVVTSATEPMTW